METAPLTPSPEADGAPRRRRELGFLAPVFVALVLWVSGAHRRSLWVDEFHSLHHDRAASLADFFRSVRTDNHPPLSFLLQRASITLFGESELALRAPTLLVGLAFLLLVRSVSRRLPDARSRDLALWVVALSSFCFDVFTEARMYGLLALSVLGLLESVLAASEGRRSRWLAVLWVAVGLHSHYYFIHYLFVILPLLGIAAWRLPDAGRRAARVLAPVVIGCLAFLPWGLWGFVHQLGHGLPSGGHYRGVNAFLQSIGHLLYLNASLGGPLVTFGVALPGTLLAGTLGLLGAGRLWSAGRGNGERSLLLLLLLGLGLGAPLWSHTVSLVFERASYGWRYIAGSVAPVAMVVASGMSGAGAARRLVQGLVLVSLALVTLACALSGGRENFRAAVAHVLVHARPGDAVLTRPLWEQDPEHSPTGWGFYCDRLALPGTPVPTEVRLQDRACSWEYERVWVFARDLHHLYALEELRARFEHEEVWSKGPGMVLYLFWNGPAWTTPRPQDTSSAPRRVDSSS